MKILHLCLACFYIDGYNYQENVLPRKNKEAGHDVYIIASTETFVDNVHLGYVSPSRYNTEYGVPIIRLPYVSFLSKKLSVKVRKYKGLYKEICQIKPDLIYMHGVNFGSVSTIVKYKKMNPDVKLYADTHTGFYNSGRNWLSLNVLHGIYYRYQIHKALPYLEKYYYINGNEKKFSKEIYKVPDSVMEFLPLGGDLPSDKEYDERRGRKRQELGLDADELLFTHSGKLDAKKKTCDLLEAFYAVPDLKAKLIIIGSISEEIKAKVESLIERDARVEYLGWKNADELMEYLCATDYYCQPGAQSATMQNAICNRCPVIAYPTDGYEELDYGNFLWVRNKEEIAEVLKSISMSQVDIDDLRAKTVRCAEELLDYKKLASRYID